MKHIVIDARLYGPKHTGIGRYTKNLLLHLARLPQFKNYRFTLLVYPELASEVKADLGHSFTYQPTAIRHYSLAEQLLLPFVLYRLKPDLVHFTHFNKPLLYLGRSVVTIHDLIKHFSRGRDTTTRHPLLYWFKYIGYLILTYVVIKTSRLLVPSNFWRNYIAKHYHLNPHRITTTYEAVDPAFLGTKSTPHPPAGYLLYTGNLYPHKNIKVLLAALSKLPKIKLKIICARGLFYAQIEKLIADLRLADRVEFLGYLPDSEFKKTYARALALIHPSYLEGFSLTGLEAMALNCPVISSNASCLPEIYRDSVIYFDPDDANQLVDRIQKLSADPKLRSKLIIQGQKQVAKYSWTKTAAQTLAVYHELV